MPSHTPAPARIRHRLTAAAAHLPGHPALRLIRLVGALAGTPGRPGRRAPGPAPHRHRRASRPGVKYGLAAIALMMLPGAFADEAPGAVEFTPAAIADWPQREFDGDVTYRLVEDDRPAVEAIAEDGATALYREIEIDVSETPWLEWSWRVEELPRGDASEREKAGDDYGARIYVVQEGFFGKLSARALNYVWSRELGAGTRWPNAFTGHEHMIAVDSGGQRHGEWITYRRDLRADWRAAFDEPPGTIHGVAIMTDSDNTNSRAAARYGPIRFTAGE